MKNIKTPFRDIYSVLGINRLIVLSVVIAAVIISTVSVLLVYKMHRDSADHAFVISTDGSVLPLKVASLKENTEVEVLAHLELFHRYFYNIDASNYKKHLDKALWLGDSSVDDLYRQKKSEGVYNRLIQYSLVQKVINITSETDIKSYPYKFKTKVLFEIDRGSITDRYELTTSGKLIRVDRNFPNNTHGLLITDFYENVLRKMSDDE